LWLLRERVEIQVGKEAIPVEETVGYDRTTWVNHICRAICLAAFRYRFTHEILTHGDPFAGPVPALLLPEEQAKEDAMTRQLQEVLGDDVEIAEPIDGYLAPDSALTSDMQMSCLEQWVTVQYSGLIREMTGLAERLSRYTAETRLRIGRERRGQDVWDVLRRQGFDAMYQRIRTYLEQIR
jgi:hypothetical protein